MAIIITNILSRIRGLRLATREALGSLLNARSWGRQAQTTLCNSRLLGNHKCRLARPIWAGLHYFTWYLTCGRPVNLGHVPSAHTRITAEHYSECALAKKANYWGKTSHPTILVHCRTNKRKDNKDRSQQTIIYYKHTIKQSFKSKYLQATKQKGT